MKFDLRWLPIVLSNLFLLLLCGEINHLLSRFSAYLFLDGLLLAFAIYRFRYKTILIANGLTIFFIAAATPLPFGKVVIAYLFLQTILYRARGRFSREKVESATIATVLFNLALFAAIAFISAAPFDRQTIVRFAIDGTLSTIAIILITPWFFALQKKALALIGIEIDAEQREAQ